MRTILKILKKNLFTIPFFILFSFFDIKLSSATENVFFTVSGIIFSICISQIMSFDLSAVKNTEKYKQFSQSLKNIQDSFLAEFAFSSFAFLSLAILDSKEIECSKRIWKFTFSLNTELQLIMIFSVIFFLKNYINLYQKKCQINEKIREEAICD